MASPARAVDWVSQPARVQISSRPHQERCCPASVVRGARSASSRVPSPRPARTSERKCTPSQTRARPASMASNRASAAPCQVLREVRVVSSSPQNSRVEAVWPLGMPNPWALWRASSGCRWKGLGHPRPSLNRCTSRVSSTMANSSRRSPCQPSKGIRKGSSASWKGAEPSRLPTRSQLASVPSQACRRWISGSSARCRALAPLLKLATHCTGLSGTPVSFGASQSSCAGKRRASWGSLSASISLAFWISPPRFGAWSRETNPVPACAWMGERVWQANTCARCQRPSSPVTRPRNPVSSNSSRRAAWAGVSPASM